MEKGTLYGVSVGPGDPELLTLKAVRVLREADVIAAPNIGHGRQTALDIVRPYVEGKELMDCSTPMLRDRTKVLEAYDEQAGRIAAKLDEGKSVAFITIGDVGVYSTYFYIHERLVSQGYEAQLVAGVTSFCASAARLGISLCEGPECLTVVPVIAGKAEDFKDVPGTLVFMKSGRDLEQVRQVLEVSGRMQATSLVANCGLSDEAVYPRFEDVPRDLSDYFTLVISKDPRPRS